MKRLKIHEKLLVLILFCCLFGSLTPLVAWGILKDFLSQNKFFIGALNYLLPQKDRFPDLQLQDTFILTISENITRFV